MQHPILAKNKGPLALLALLFFSVFGGSLIAPWIFNGLTALGRAIPALDSLRDLTFESVISRCVLILLVLGLVPAARLAGFRRFRDLGFESGFFRVFFRGFWIGAVSLLLVALLGWVLGVYTLNIESRMTRPGRLAIMILGAGIVGIMEEMIFRGFIHRALRSAWKPWLAVLVSSVFFSAVHFAKPYPDLGVVYGRWDSGLAMISDIFHTGHSTYHYFPYALTLFIMGLVLALRFERNNHRLGNIAGLHAGWVLVMLAWGYCFDHSGNTEAWWAGQSDVLGKSPSALLLALLFLGWEVWVWRRSAVCPRGEHGESKGTG